MARIKSKTSIALDPELIRRLDRVAKAARQSRSELITDLVVGGLDQAEMMISATSDPVLMAAVGKVMSDPGVLRNMINGMRSELSDQQLELFRSRLDAMTTDAMNASNMQAKSKQKKKRIVGGKVIRSN